MIDIISNLTSCNIGDITPILSDHLIVILSIENFLDIKNNKRNIPLKKTYDFDMMSENKWAAFSDKFDALATGCYLRYLINNTIFNQNKLNYF
ncbi:6665_t:CDS:2 [Funneliformis geosporum]|uniref:6665_t:CDS:1 n=1 Tax=Funneliformis geosporum TaxID=1117311 RepID=A0A9W4X1Z8_9GLOM|nr:6665_t:CDS:2 [Funneliformis geosporum]